MKRITIVNGSRRINGTSAFLSLSIKKFLEENYNDYILDIFNPQELELKPCQGCCSCFFKGYCPLDKIDSGELMKNKFIESDLLIIISPVYAHNVTSDMKKVIDRISYWLHIFRLIGKPVIILTVTDSNGDSYVSDYLKKMFLSFGCTIALSQTIISADMTLGIDGKLLSLYEKINEILSNKFESKINAYQEAIFQTYKYTYMFDDDESAEKKYWKENGLFDIDNLLQYLFIYKGK